MRRDACVAYAGADRANAAQHLRSLHWCCANRYCTSR